MVLIPAEERKNYFSEEDENTTVGSDEYRNSEEKATYEPKHLFLLCNKEMLKKRIEEVQHEKQQIATQQLSTNETAPRLELMKTDDLIESILFRFKKRNPQVPSVRSSNLTYYNWLIVDLARRMEIVQKRVKVQFSHTWEVEFRRKVIDAVARNTPGWSFANSGSKFPLISESREYFDFFVPFVETKRKQVLEVVQIFGDEICAFVEFIDMYDIGNLPKEEFQVFVNELSAVKDKLRDSIEMLKPLFENDPVHPFETLTRLN